jgi:hypothetical protein
LSRSLADFFVEDFDEQPADEALGLGIADAGQRGEVAVGRATRMTLTPMCSAIVAMTWSPSRQRSRPVSTKTVN